MRGRGWAEGSQEIRWGSFIKSFLLLNMNDGLCVCVGRIREAAKSHKLVEQELAHSVNATALVLTEAFPSKPSSPEVSSTTLPRSTLTHNTSSFLTSTLPQPEWKPCVCAERARVPSS